MTPEPEKKEANPILLTALAGVCRPPWHHLYRDLDGRVTPDDNFC